MSEGLSSYIASPNAYVPGGERNRIEAERQKTARHFAHWLADHRTRIRRRHIVSSRQERLKQEVARTQNRLHAYQAMAEYAIALTLKREQDPLPQKQMAKRRAIATAWRNMYQRLMFKT